MTHLLHLDSSPRGERSVSRRLAGAFVTNWQAAHAEGTVTYRDLGHQPIPIVTEAWVAAAYTPPEQHSPEQAAAIQISDALIDEFLAADRAVLSVPMYNFGVPANLKAYIDQIVRVGRTFAVTEAGYQGLVQGKKLLVITAAGGSYAPGSPAQAYDFLSPYLKAVFGFIGVTDTTFVHADSLALGDEARDRSIAQAQAALQDAIAGW